MTRKRKTYNVFQLTSAIFMVLALLWLTVSIPFVNATQQLISNQDKSAHSNTSDSNETEDNNPFSNTTEEKNSSSNTFSEEYLHHHHDDDYIISASSQFHKCENAGTYIAFHGELLVPPPNQA